MKYEYYVQMPPTIDVSGTNTLTITPNPTPGNITRLKSLYMDLPAGVALNVNLSILTGQSDIVSNGNEAGSIVFRSGIVMDSPIAITVTGVAGTIYGVKIITEVETPDQIVAQAGISGLLALGLVVGFVYMATKKIPEKRTYLTKE